MENEILIIISICTVLMIVLFLIIMLFLLSWIFKNKRNQEKELFEVQLKNKELELMTAVVQAQEQERAKIARNLHDEVGSILSMAQQNLSVAIKQIPIDAPFLEDAEFTMDVLEQSVSKIRSISQGMLPHFLLKFGLQKATQRLVEQAQKTLGNPCIYNWSVKGNLALDRQFEIHFYSITLELMNNLLKHAKPQSLSVSINVQNGCLLLQLNHDGVAISQADYEYLLNHGDGMGLETVAHRLKLIKGEIQYQRHSLGGKIELAMPIIETDQTHYNE
jgi:signal transduction histidine kinase